MTRSVAILGILSALSTLTACAPGRGPDAPIVGPGTPAGAVQLEPAFAEVERWVARGAFPGAVLAFGRHGRLIALRSFGRIEASPSAPPMPTDAIFDLASLTKVVATTTAAAILYDRGKLDLDAPVVRYRPEFGGLAGHDAITVRHLLTHSSGLAPTGLLWQRAHDRAAILRELDLMPVDGVPGRAYRYQDVNIILLGDIVERLSGRPLDRFVQAEIFAPLGMRDTGFNPPRSKLLRIAPTEQDDSFRKMLVRGVVHDENAYVMGGVAGHAGLFSTARDLSKFARLYLGGGQVDGRRLLRPGTVQLFMTRQGLPPQSARALGWDMPSGEGGLAGRLGSPRAIMHTGFTGTSIYIDPDRDAFVILLTNRVNPTRDNALIGQARPAIHTAVLSSLDAVPAR